uniref:(northern house mosquito) hypothetical protein n=1 Tax=Culex pipiens TaxID=7175 RepID=A0A8D8EYH5_CULPI
MEDRLEDLPLTGVAGDGKKSSEISQKNMAHLLLQGLHSKDAGIQRSVFSRNEPDLIQRTAFWSNLFRRCGWRFHADTAENCACRNGRLLTQGPHSQSHEPAGLGESAGQHLQSGHHRVPVQKGQLEGEHGVPDQELGAEAFALQIE